MNENNENPNVINQGINSGMNAGTGNMNAGNMNTNNYEIHGEVKNEKDVTPENLSFFMKVNYPFFGWGSFIYAIFFTFCLYRNSMGITFPFFTAATLIYFIVCVKKFGVPLKGITVFYAVAIELLGVSTCMTTNGTILFYNKAFIYFLMLSFMIHTFYNDKNWHLGKRFLAMWRQIFVSLGWIHKPIADMLDYRDMIEKPNTEGKKKRISGPILIGLAIAFPLTFVILILLATSDAVFREFFLDIFRELSIGSIVVNSIGIVLTIVAIFFTSYMMLSYICERRIPEESGETRLGEPLIAVTVAGVLSVVYLCFCFIQVRYLFLGRYGTLTLPRGLTYASYARQGFFQLLFVCVLNIVIVLVGIYLFRPHPLLKTFLAVITLCTYIMTASSALRMLMYIQSQYLTFMRVAVLATCGVIILILLGLTVNIFAHNFPLYQYAVVVVTFSYIAFSFARVDLFVAKINVANMTTEGQYEFFKGTDLYDDIDYLINDLSLDAAPAILKADTGSKYKAWDDAKTEYEKNRSKSVYSDYDYRYFDDDEFIDSDDYAMKYITRFRDDLDYSPRQWNFSKWYANVLLHR